MKLKNFNSPEERKERMKVGDLVRLKGKRRTSQVDFIYNIENCVKGVRLNKPLGGYRYWNKKDLEKLQ